MDLFHLILVFHKSVKISSKVKSTCNAASFHSDEFFLILDLVISKSGNFSFSYYSYSWAEFLLQRQY